MRRALDKARINEGLLLYIPYREMTGQVVRDHAKPHHPLTGHNLTWASGPPITPSDIGTAVFDGASTYIDSPAADTADLDFTTGDYSIAVWFYYQVTTMSQILIGRYGVDLDGWELYIYDPGLTLNLRHHHSSLAPAPVRSACASGGWSTGAWHFAGISRSGAYPLHYRNGVPLEMIYDPVGGLSDPDSCNRDLVGGCRFTKDANWYSGYKAPLRVWDRGLEGWEFRQLFEMERHWFGV